MTFFIHVLPLIAAPANQWLTLMTVLQLAQNINTQVVGPDKKTIITLDMDLYARALKLQTLKPDDFKHMVLRVGEVHTVLCALRAIGSSIEGSGIDDTWIEVGLYGPATARQILEGKHIKRALDAHVITVQALGDLLLEEYDESAFEELKPIAITVGISCAQHDCLGAKEAHQRYVSGMAASRFLDMKKQVLEGRKDRPLCNVIMAYMDTVSVLLSFIPASRE